VTRTALHVLFALSGASALIYQVVWVRHLGLVFGTTVAAASAVLAVFLGGMGLGAWCAGRYIDRRPDAGLRSYGVAEVWIAGWGLLLAWLLPALPEWIAAWTQHAISADGWWEVTASTHALRVVLTAILLGPSALAMGATLTWLSRHLISDAEGAGSRIGWLTAANTAGAALGALAADLIAIPWLGLWGTQVGAVFLNLLAGVGALTLRLPAATVDPDPGTARGPGSPAVALLLTGFAAMGLELVWLRFLGGALGPYRGVLALVLATVLVGLALGSALAATALRRGVLPATALATSQAVVVLTALGGLAWFDPEAVLRRQWSVVPAFLDGGPWVRAWLVHRVNATAIAGLVAPAAIAMGAAFPLANALAQVHDGQVGRTTGQLSLATTVGNVSGSLLTGFVVLPSLGLQATALLLAAVAWTAGAVVGPRGWRGNAALAVAAVGLAAFWTLPAEHLLWRSFPANRAAGEGVLAVREGTDQLMVVTGDPAGPARLWTSGHPMTSTTPHAQRYMRLMAHLPLLLHPQAQRVLVIAFGAGNTTHAASLHPVGELHVADLSRDVLELSPHFTHSNRGVLSDPRVSVFVQDGRHHLWQQPPGHYDVITLEPPPLAAAGVSALYTREFYALAKHRLSAGGQVAQWLPAYQVPEADVLALVAAFVAVFPESVLLMASGRELVLLGGGRPFDPDAVAAVLRQRPAVAADLAAQGFTGTAELARTFLSDAATMRAAVRGTPPLCDDRPTLEHAQASHLQQTALPAGLFAPERIGSWCRPCAADPVVAALVATEAFLSFDSTGADSTSWLPPPDLSAATLQAMVESPGLGRVLRAPDALALRAKELWQAGAHDAARAHLDLARRQAPGVPLLEETAAAWAP